MLPEHTGTAHPNFNNLTKFFDTARSLINLTKRKELDVQLCPESRVSIADLKKSKNVEQKDKFLLCRVTSQGVRCPTLRLVVDDPEGDYSVFLYLNNYTHISGRDQKRIGEMFPVGTIMAVMNPIFKVTPDNGLGVWVEKPRDIITRNTELAVFNFKSDLPEVPVDNSNNDVKKDPDDSDTCTLDELMSEAHALLDDNKFSRAVDVYNRAINILPEETSFLLNRSCILMRLDNLPDALIDLDRVLKNEPTNETAVYRKAIVMNGLGKTKEATDFIDQANTLKPISSYKSHNVRKLKEVLLQQLAGIYDMAYFHNKYNSDSPSLVTFLDCADYLGPINIIKRYKGRGVFATEDIKPGQLVMAVRALGFCYNNKDEDSNPEVRATDGFFDTAEKKGHRQMVNYIVNKLQKRPELRKDVYALARRKIDSSKIDPTEPVDVARVFQVCKRFEIVENYANSSIFISERMSSGVWTLISFFKHACVNANINRVLLKEFAFVRAVREIRKGEELTMQWFTPRTSTADRYTPYDFSCDCKFCVLDNRETHDIKKKRQKILDSMKKLTYHGPGLNYDTLMKTHIKKLEKLVSDPKLNFAAMEAYKQLALYYYLKGKHVQAAAVFEKLTDNFLDYLPADAFDAALNALQSYRLARKKDDVIRLIPKFKILLLLIHDCDDLDAINKNIDQYLKDEGIDFSSY